MVSGQRAADDDWRVVAEQEAHGHELDAVGEDGDDFVAVVGHGPVVGAEHHGDGRAVEVAIAEADPGAGGRERHGEVGGHRGFPDAALARGHRDDLLHARDGRATFAGLAAGGGGGRRFGFDLDGHGVPARDRVQHGVAVLGDFFGNGGVGGLDFDADADLAVLHLDVFDEAEGDDVPGEPRVGDFGESFADRVGCHAGRSVARDDLRAKRKAGKMLDPWRRSV